MYLLNKMPDYQELVLPSFVKARVAIEAGASLSWYPWVGLEGAILGIDSYGKSAPYARVFEDFGLTPEAIVQAAKRVIERQQKERITA